MIDIYYGDGASVPNAGPSRIAPLTSSREIAEMTEKKDKFTEEYEELQDEIIRDKVKEVFTNDPGNYRDGLEEIGFTWHDDNYPSEEDEENGAVPVNDRQRLLVSYFEGKAELSTAVVDALEAEKNCKEPNYPLIRKYFRAANPYLKALILSGLKDEPTNFDLLTGLIFFHEFDRNLPELIAHLTNGCRLAVDLQDFSEIALEFYYAAQPDGYHALYALRDIFDAGSDKRQIIDSLIKGQEDQDPGIVF